MTFKYDIGQEFEKVGGDYTFHGWIIGRFRKRGGLIRYAGENEQGLIFIFNESAIKPL